jgi:hypothetical protein
LLLQAPAASQVPIQLSASSLFITVTQALLTHERHTPAQSVSPQQPPVGMQSPPQGVVPVPQLYEHVCAPVSHFPVFPFCGGQSTSSQQPVMGMQPVLQGLVPCAHVKAQLFPSQVAVAPWGGMHASHEAPQ